MNLTPGVTIERGDTVTRQTIFDLVNLAVGSSVLESDLDSQTLPPVNQSEAPTPSPGRIWYDQTDQLAKVFVDVLDGTGISTWLAFGPDRFDIAVLATEDIPQGAAVQFTGEGRKVKKPPSVTALGAMSTADYDNEIAQVIGFNNNTGEGTAASGTWFACAVEGLVKVWYPMGRVTPNYRASIGGFDSLIFSTADATAASLGADYLRGGIVWDNISDVTTNQNAWLVKSTHVVDPQFSTLDRQLFVGPRMNRRT